MRQINLKGAGIFDTANPDFIRFEPDPAGNRLLWVVASHVNVPAGKFAQSHIFARMPGAKLFLNCAENAWYQNGPGGGMRGLRELVTAIGRFSEGFETTHFVGHSMGAYLALICAHEFDRGGHFIATSPEPVLCRRASRSRDNHVVPRFGWRDLIRRYRRHPPRSPGVTIFGAYDPVDAGFLAEATAHPGFYGTLAAVPHHHGVTEYLTGRRRYLQLLTAPGDEISRLIGRGLAAAAPTPETAARFARFNQAYIKMRDGSWAAAGKLAAADTGWENAGWQALSASIFRHRHDHQNAVTAGKRAFGIAPGEAIFAREYALALIAAGRGGELRRLHQRLGKRKTMPPALTRVMTEIERSGLLEARTARNRSITAAKRPDWAVSLAAFEKARAAHQRARTDLALARAVAAAFPRASADPDLSHAMIETLVAAGLRQSAVTLLEGAQFAGARGLAQRVRLLLPNPVERHFDGNFY